MSQVKRSVVGLVVALSLFMAVAAPVLAVGGATDTWRMRFPIHTLCEGDPGYCSCSTC